MDRRSHRDARGGGEEFGGDSTPRRCESRYRRISAQEAWDWQYCLAPKRASDRVSRVSQTEGFSGRALRELPALDDPDEGQPHRISLESWLELGTHISGNGHCAENDPNSSYNCAEAESKSAKRASRRFLIIVVILWISWMVVMLHSGL